MSYKKKHFFVLSFFLFGCGLAQNKKIKKNILSNEKKIDLQEAVDESYDDLQVPGVVVLIDFPDGNRWLYAKGLSQITPFEKKMISSLRFRIGSVTKTFTATTILQLIDEKRISLTDSVKTILGDIIPRSDEITINHLLGMSSGLSDYVTKDFWKDVIEKPESNFLPSDLLKMSQKESKKNLIFDPGTDWQYCNTNYILLGMIIEKITNNSYANEITKRFIKPLGLKNTSVPLTKEISGDFARGYVFSDSSNPQWKDLSLQSPSGPWAAGNMVSQAEDLAIWTKNFVGGKLISKKSKKLMYTWKSTNEKIEPQFYGLGVMKYNNAVGHLGSIGGYRAGIFNYLDHTFVILMNAYPSHTKTRDHYALYILDKIKKALDLI